MKTNNLITIVGTLVFTLGLLNAATTGKLLDLGSTAPMADVKMKDITGEMVSLESAKGEEGLLVVFSCNTCPWVIAWQDRYPGIAEKARAGKIGMIVLNSNEARRGGGDSFEDMVKHAEENGYHGKDGKPLFRYVLDKNHKVADAFGASRTPELFLFNKAGKLVYRGAIDDNAKKPKEVKATYILDALDDVTAGKTPKTSSTKSLGCSIKRL